MKYQFRAVTKMFMKRETGKVSIKPSHCIECLKNHKWQLFGDENGIVKFTNKEDRDAKLKELLAIDFG
jgi:hypothetical protein